MCKAYFAGPLMSTEIIQFIFTKCKCLTCEAIVWPVDSHWVVSTKQTVFSRTSWPGWVQPGCKPCIWFLWNLQVQSNSPDVVRLSKWWLQGLAAGFWVHAATPSGILTCDMDFPFSLTWPQYLARGFLGPDFIPLIWCFSKGISSWIFPSIRHLTQGI